MKNFSDRTYKRNFFKQAINNFFYIFGYEVIKKGTKERIQNYSDDFLELISKKNYSEFTMLSLANQYSLFQSVKYISLNKIPGDIVECGVWRGGAMMLAVDTLKMLGDESRTIWLYDTFSGMTEPTEKDVSINGNDARTIIKQKESTNEYVDWCYADLQDVTQNLISTGYSNEKLKFIKGDVAKTIPDVLPETIALLRLDTDWYDSTVHEMKNLYPRLVKNGVLIVDDYGTWAGSAQAVDEYFKNEYPLLNRIDHTAVLKIK